MKQIFNFKKGHKQKEQMYIRNITIIITGVISIEWCVWNKNMFNYK